MTNQSMNTSSQVQLRGGATDSTGGLRKTRHISEGLTLVGDHLVPHDGAESHQQDVLADAREHVRDRGHALDDEDADEVEAEGERHVGEHHPEGELPAGLEWLIRL